MHNYPNPNYNVITPIEVRFSNLTIQNLKSELIVI